MEESATRDLGEAPAYSWYALAVLFLVYVFNFIDRQILSILANDIKADLGLDDAQLGFLYGTAFAIFYALFGIPLGRLADRWSRIKLLSLGVALWSSMTLLSGFAKNAATLTVARVGVGVGEATANPCAYSLLSDWFPPRMRATAIAIYSAGLFAGSGLSLVLGGMIVGSWNNAYPTEAPLGLAGWQAAFLALGLPGIALSIWVLTLREPQGERHNPTGGERERRPWPEVVTQVLSILPPFTVVSAARRGTAALVVNLSVAAALAALAATLSYWTGNGQQFWFVAVGYYAVFTWATALRAEDRPVFLMTWGSSAFMALVAAYGAVCFLGYSVTYWAAPFAERVFDLDKSELGWLIGAPSAVGGFVGVIAGGRLADVLHRKTSSGRAYVLLIALVGSVPVVGIGYTTNNLTAFLICNFLVQIFTSSALGAAAAATQSLVLPRMRGVATAVFLLGATLIGLAFGPFTAGFVSEATGSLATGVLSTLAAVPPGILAVLIAAKRMQAASEMLARPA